MSKVYTLSQNPEVLYLGVFLVLGLDLFNLPVLGCLFPKGTVEKGETDSRSEGVFFLIFLNLNWLPPLIYLFSVSCICFHAKRKRAQSSRLFYILTCAPITPTILYLLLYHIS